VAPTPTPEPLTASAGDDRPAFIRDLDTLIRARYPLVYLVSWEEQRVDALLEDLANTHGKTLYHWSVMRGLKRQGGGGSRNAATGEEDSREPRNVLLAIEKIDEPSIVVLKDFHAWFQDAAVVRGLRELSHSLKTTYTTVILLSPTLNIPTGSTGIPGGANSAREVVAKISWGPAASMRRDARLTQPPV